MACQPYLEKQLSYIDALFDREHDRIHVVERREGERRYQEYPANYVLYYEDARGKFTSILELLSVVLVQETTKSSARKSAYTRARSCTRVILIPYSVVLKKTTRDKTAPS